MIPRTIFTTDDEILRESVRRFLETEASPYHEQWEKDGQVSRALWLKAGEQGFLCPTVAETYGGYAASFSINCVIVEEIFRLGLTGLGFGLHSDIVAPYIEHYAQESLKHRVLPAMVRGEKIGAIAMTEPGAGSDLQGVKTTAVQDGEEWVLNGSKTFITNGQMCDIVIVVAVTDSDAGSKGISLFLVEEGMPGFEKGKNLNKVGMKAQDTSELFFSDVRVPAENLIGEQGKGFIYLMQELPQERLGVAVGAMANAESILEQTIAYTKERKAFGKSISQFQNTEFILAQLHAEVSAMRVYTDRCIELHLDGKLSIPDAASVKMLTTDLQCRVADECMQLHGGYGYMWEYPVARAWADSRVQRIYAGTNEIMKLIISRDLLKC